MTKPPINNDHEQELGFLAGGGEIGKLIRQKDWTTTPLGRAKKWPQSLQSALSICLGSTFPIAIYWGKELTLIYNEAWSPILGAKHPWALGKPAIEVWPEIWSDIGPLFKKVFETGEAVRNIDALLPMQRHGYIEECYFDFTFTPIRGENGKVEGIFNAVVETTYRVVNDRRTHTIQQFAENLNLAKSENEIFSIATEELEKAIEDVPFALVYLNSSDDTFLKKVISTGAKPTSPQFIEMLDNEEKSRPFAQIIKSGHAYHLVDNADFFGGVIPSAWPEPSTETLILPIGLKKPVGFLVAGLNPRRILDADYQSFLESLSLHLANTIFNVRSLAQERERARKLAEIDKAKTVFFSNVSHEFRTPLTLLLGPVQDLLNERLDDNIRQQLEVIHRNGLRLRKLVNALLDFSRLEAGRTEANYISSDLATFTAELASNFRSAIEKAGIKLTVNTPPLSTNAYVDVDMWEKILLNLLSNAFKFTFTGEIEVSLSEKKNSVVLTVRDTGEGIPHDDLPHIFERFKRVEGTKSRSIEGSGIGLSLVKELVKLHGGTIKVKSKVGEGTTFMVTIPKGKDHLPQELIESKPLASSNGDNMPGFIKEVEQWLPSEKSNRGNNFKGEIRPLPGFSGKPLIVLADDNADVRNYIKRLLDDRFDLVATANGKEALQEVRKKHPDLLIADVMMPVMDGFDLLKELKANPETDTIPVILLSARAGEESRIEGIKSGADDYILKPFSSNELIARVSALVAARQSRHETEKRLYDLLMQVPAFIAVLRGPEYVFELFNSMYANLVGRDRDLIGKPLQEALPEIKEQGFIEALDEVYNTGQPYFGTEIPVFIDRQEKGNLETVYMNFVYQPLKTEEGNVDGIFVHGVDVTQQVKALRGIAISEEKYRSLFERMDQGFTIIEMIFNSQNKPIDYKFLEVNPNFEKQTGLKDVIGKTVRALVPNLEEWWFKIYGKVALTGKAQRFIEESKAMGRWFEVYAFRLGGDDSRKVALLVSDITERRETEPALRKSEERFRTLADNIPNLCWMANADGWIYWYNSRWYEYTGTTQDEMEGWGWESVHDPEILPLVLEKWTTALMEGHPFEMVFPLKGKDGNFRPFLTRIVPIKDDKGQVLQWFGTNTDISKQKQTETDLQQVKDQLTTTFQNVPSGIVLYGKNGEVLFGNKLGAYFQGFSSVDELLSLRNVSEVHKRFIENFEVEDEQGKPIPPEKSVVKRALRGEEHCENIAHYFDKMKRVDKWVLVRANPISDEQGNIQMALLSITDITEQKRAEEALKRSANHYKIMTDNTPVMTWVTRPDGNCTFLNQQWYDYTGQKPEDGWGGGRLNAIHPDDVQKFSKVFLKSNQDQVAFSCEYRLKDYAGEYCWHLDKGLPKFDNEGNFEGHIGAVVNIHERKIAEEKLARSEDNLKLAVEVSDLGTWEYWPKSNQFYASERCKGLFGLYSNINLDFDLFRKGVHPDDRDWVLEQVQQALYSKNEGRIEMEFRTIGIDDKRLRWIRAKAQAYYGKAKDSSKLLGTFFDITTQVEAKEALTQSHRRLQKLVKARTKELVAANNSLQRTNSELNRFAYVTSHDLKAPLRGISTIATWLKEDYSDKLDENGLEQLKMMQQRVKRMYSLIDGILHYSRAGGDIENDRTAVNVKALIEEIVANLNVPPDFRIKYGKLPVIQYDSVKLYQIFQNLIANAVKFNDKAAGEGEIHIESEESPDHYLFKVSDNGPGIPDKYHNRIFELFQTLGSPGEEQNTGLGLAIIKKIIEFGGGKIWVESEKEKGATFLFTILKPAVA